jgi:hypothetical protein
MEKEKRKKAKSFYLTVKTWAYVKLLFSYDRRVYKNVVELGHCILQTFPKKNESANCFSIKNKKPVQIGPGT